MDAIGQQPLACCLNVGEYQDRIVWIASLTRRAILHYSRADLALSLPYTPEAVADVRKMVEQERICCAFLKFELDEEPDAIRVTITAPEAAVTRLAYCFSSFSTAHKNGTTVIRP
jgi:hypothetical protein